MHDGCVRMWMRVSSAKPCAATGLGSRQIALLRHEHELGAAGKASCSVCSPPPRLGNAILPSGIRSASHSFVLPTRAKRFDEMRPVELPAVNQRDPRSWRPFYRCLVASQLQWMVETLHKASASYIKKGAPDHSAKSVRARMIKTEANYL